MSNLHDFSPKSVSRAVLKHTLSQPYVLYPAAIGILGGLAALVIAPTLAFGAMAAIGGLVGAGAFGIDFGLRRDRLARDYLERMHKVLAERVQKAIIALQADLSRLKNDQALRQLSRLQIAFDTTGELLRRKLNPSELTYGRFLGMTEQVYLAGLDNLRQISDALQGLTVVDPRRDLIRLDDLAQLTTRTAAQEGEMRALLDRQALVARQRAKIETWLVENEQALTQMDHVIAAIADMTPLNEQAQMDMGPALQELKTLIDRAHQYIRADSDEATRVIDPVYEQPAQLQPPQQRS